MTITVIINLIVHISFLFNIGMIIIIISRCESSAVRTVSLITIGLMALWNVGTILELDFRLITGVTHMLFINICYIGICLLPIAVLCLGRVNLQSSCRPKPLHALFLVIPLVSIVVVFTDPLHHLFFVNFSLYSSEAVYGPYFYFHSLYSYGCITAGIVLMFIASTRQSGLFSKQSVLVITGVLITVVPNMFYTFGVGNLPFSISAAAFTFSILCFAIAFLKYRFISALPITLREVVDLISDGYLVVDNHSFVLSYNRALLHMFPEPFNLNMGEHLRALIEKYFLDSPYEKFLRLQAQAAAERKTVSIEAKIAGGPYVVVEITPVMQKGTQNGFIILLKDVTQSKLLIDATKAANEAKTDFLANMSHEMRTPLNAVICLSSLSLDAGRLSEEDQSNLEKIYSAGATLLSTVNDILDISKIEAGRMELVPVDYDVPSVINDTLTQNILRIGGKPIELKLDIGEDVFSRLNGDELRVKQIINNLLSNAIKYTNNGTVELSFHNASDNGKVIVTIKVSDTGIGIRQEDIAKLFSDYAQVNKTANRKTEGTGLGLSITRRLAEMMDGSITVESEFEKGSVFTVVITQKNITDIKISPEIVENLKKFSYADNGRTRDSHLKRISLHYARVLVVDDNMTNLDVARGLMKPYGLEIDCVTSGRQAIDAIRAEEGRYNAVFMDHMMLEMDGIEAAGLIREIGSDYAKNIPIIALTANAIAGNEEMFLSKGFQGFLPKPIDITRLDELLRQWVRDEQQEKLFAEQQYELLESWQERRSVSDRRSMIDRRKSKMEFAGLDIKKGIKLFGGDEEIYYDILRSYVVDSQPLLESMAKINEDKLSDYAIIAHGLKGSSRAIFADMIGDAAEGLEKAAKAGDINYINAHNQTFLNAAWQLIRDLDEMLKP